MAMNPLPPQAYTRETLQKAYQWLLTQNSSIKEMASNQELLVSLYLKAQRNGEASLEAPSIQNFKQELKSLANMMGDFQTAQNTQTPSPQISSPTTHQQQAQTAAQNTTTTPSNNNNLEYKLDQQTLNYINEVKTSLNLSSDTEALRALIAIGFKQFKKINN